MAYPNRHLYLTAHWHTAGTDEKGQFGLRFDTTAAASQSLVNSVAGRVATMWATTGAAANIANEHLLDFVRLASIDTDGRYVTGTLAYDYIWGSPVAGGSALAGYTYPLQVAHVVTLRTAVPRGLAHAGRIYLPPIDEVLSSNFQWTAADCTGRNNTVASMITGLNTDFGAPCAVFSKVGGGAKHNVVYVQGDTRPDVQRRRARQMVPIGSIAAAV